MCHVNSTRTWIGRSETHMHACGCVSGGGSRPPFPTPAWRSAMPNFRSAPPTAATTTSLIVPPASLPIALSYRVRSTTTTDRLFGRRQQNVSSLSGGRANRRACARTIRTPHTRRVVIVLCFPSTK